jgi:F-type H+-transporting ATPase subunit epsilon
MADRVQFELVTPERLIVSTEVEMVVVPGTEGNFGVLPGHAPLISTIRPGTIDIYEGRAITERIFVVGGIAEVIPERCTVLADEAIAPDALDDGAVLIDVDRTRPDRRDQRRVARQDAEIALAARYHHHLDLGRDDQALRRHQLELDAIGHLLWSLGYAASAAILRALSTASSIVPTM